MIAPIEDTLDAVIALLSNEPVAVMLSNYSLCVKLEPPGYLAVVDILNSARCPL